MAGYSSDDVGVAAARCNSQTNADMVDDCSAEIVGGTGSRGASVPGFSIKEITDGGDLALICVCTDLFQIFHDDSFGVEFRRC